MNMADDQLGPAVLEFIDERAAEARVHAFGDLSSEIDVGVTAKE